MGSQLTPCLTEGYLVRPCAYVLTGHALVTGPTGRLFTPSSRHMPPAAALRAL